MNRYQPILVLAIALSVLAGPLTDFATAQTPPASGRVVVSFEPGTQITVDKSAGVPRTGVSSLDAVLDRHGVVTLEPLFGGMIEMFDDPATRADLARHYIVLHADKAGDDGLNADLQALAMVEEAVSDVPMKQHGTAYMPNDLVTPQWHLRNATLGGGDTRALGGWAESLGDTNIVVAVLDSGVDWHHPDLGGPHPDKVNGAMWTNWTEYYGTAGVDDDGNGYIDDFRGWDYVNIGSGSVWPGEDYGPPDNDPMDFGGHGTLVSGCISPITDNGIGLAGIAPGCKIMAVRIGWLSNDGNGYAYPTYMAQAFVYATANGADIINLSYSTGYSSAFASAVQAALNAGLVICVSAGNENNDEAGYLQGHADDRVLTVAASNSSDGKSDFSSYGTWIDVTAPGSSIYTTAFSHETGESTYGTTQGTSFSSPITAGACALIWSAEPGFSSAQVAALIQDTCDDIDHLNPGYEGWLGSGRINLLRALGDNEQLVPQEFFDIQDAINMATPGDVVKVLASETLGLFTVVGKDLLVEGAYAAGYGSRDPMGTPTMVESLPTTPVLDFYGDVTNTTVVDGFYLTGGGGRTFANIPYSGRYGGGLMLNQKSPTLRNLTITGNSVGNNNTLGLGGGVAMYNSDAVLENVMISGNTAIYGGGVFIYQGSPTLTNVTIDGNTLITENIANVPIGGAMHVIDADVTLDGVTCTNHLGADKGGGIYAADLNGSVMVTMIGGEISGNTAKTNGAGFCASGGTIDLTDVLVADNSQSATATFMGGGGFYADGSTITFTGLEFDGNSTHSGSGAQFNVCPDVTMSETVFTDNSALIFGGTVYLTGCTSSTMTNLTIADNSCPGGGAGIYSVNTPTTVTGTISAFNTGPGAIANGMYITGAATLSCNDVFGNEGAAYGGVSDPTGTDGNVALDPQFCDRGEGDYRVSPNGPCAPAHSGGCDLIGALEADCGAVNAVDDPAVPVAFRVDQNFPNPFNPATTIRFALPAAARTSVVIYDVKGRAIKTLVDSELEAATHTFQWRGRDDQGRSASAGIYFYRVTSGDHQAVGRMALIK